MNAFSDFSTYTDQRKYNGMCIQMNAPTRNIIPRNKSGCRVRKHCEILRKLCQMYVGRERFLFLMFSIKANL